MTSSTQHAIVKVSILSGLTGALFALMFAPRSGRETRRQLRRAGRELLHKGQYTAADTVPEGLTPDERISAALASEQEQMRMKREDKRQMPILSNWEREL